MTQTPEALRARAARRRHLQQRQTVVFGALIVALLATGLGGLAVWTGVIESPVNVPIYSGPQPEAPPTQAPPCPPADTQFVPFESITVNVLNGTDVQGRASLTATVLRSYGVQTEREENGAPYGGVAQFTTGPDGVAAAYSLAGAFSESQIVLDTREDATIDVLLGERFEAVAPAEQAKPDTEAVIPTPSSCLPVTPEGTAADEEPTEAEDEG